MDCLISMLIFLNFPRPLNVNFGYLLPLMKGIHSAIFLYFRPLFYLQIIVFCKSRKHLSESRIGAKTVYWWSYVKVKVKAPNVYVSL